MMLLMQTLLPDPVEPAISTWGILPMSPMTFSPDRVLPRAKVKGLLLLINCGVSMISRRPTISENSLGTSIPTAALPGIGASMRISEVARLRAKSLDRLTNLLTLTPGSSCNSKRVILGPTLTSMILALTPKFFKVSSMILAFLMTSSFFDFF